MARSTGRITPRHVRHLAEQNDPAAFVVENAEGSNTTLALFRAPSGAAYVRIRHTNLTTTLWAVDDPDTAVSGADRIVLGRETAAAVLDAIVGAL